MVKNLTIQQNHQITPLLPMSNQLLCGTTPASVSELNNRASNDPLFAIIVGAHLINRKLQE